MKDKIINRMKTFVSYESPDHHKSGTFGYKPNFGVKVIRILARILIVVLRLNSNKRFFIELQQQLDPVIEIDILKGNRLYFVTGHGRLVWRAKTLLTEEKSMIKWVDSFSDDDILFDVGANVGSYSLYAAKTKKIKVFSFEPEINNFQLLYANIHKNQLHEYITPVNLALHNKTTTTTFHIRSFSKGEALNCIGRKAIYVTDSSDNIEQKALCMTGDDLVDIFKMPRPTKIKIDVDTNELQVIEGMKKTLLHVEEIYIELDVSFSEHKTVLLILNNMGFVIKEKCKAKAPNNYKVSNYIFAKFDKNLVDKFVESNS